MSLCAEDELARDFRRVEDVLVHRQEQRESVALKDTPVRVEFRFRRGTRHYQYFSDMESARNARDHSATYGPTGRVVIESPSSQQIQTRGTRGGWKPHRIIS